MALFDRDNYDRDFNGRWGGGPEYGGRPRGGGFMGAVRRGIDRVEHGVRDTFDRDDNRYDRGFGHHPGASAGMGGGAWGNRGWSGSGRGMTDMSAYDRDFSGARDDHRFQGTGGYSGDLGYRGTEPGWSTAYNYDRDFNYGRPRGGYDREFGARRGMNADAGRMDYDRDMNDWRNRQQTDAGDPFGDRQSHTPIRVMRGGFDRGGMDRGEWGGQMARGGDADYGRDYRGWNQGIGDEPYYNTGDFRRNPNRF